MWPRMSLAAIEVRMNLAKVAQPVGGVPHIAARFRHTAPEFGALVLLPSPPGH